MTPVRRKRRRRVRRKPSALALSGVEGQALSPCVQIPSALGATHVARPFFGGRTFRSDITEPPPPLSSRPERPAFSSARERERRPRSGGICFASFHSACS